MNIALTRHIPQQQRPTLAELLGSEVVGAKQQPIRPPPPHSAMGSTRPRQHHDTSPWTHIKGWSTQGELCGTIKHRPQTQCLKNDTIHPASASLIAGQHWAGKWTPQGQKAIVRSGTEIPLSPARLQCWNRYSTVTCETTPTHPTEPHTVPLCKTQPSVLNRKYQLASLLHLYVSPPPSLFCYTATCQLSWTPPLRNLCPVVVLLLAVGGVLFEGWAARIRNLGHPCK